MASQRKKKPQDIAKEEATPYAVDPADRTVPSEGPSPHPGGRPKLYEGPTVRLNLLLPEDSAKLIRHIAVEEGMSPSQVIERWARQADLDRGIAQGLKDFREGRIVDHEEVVRRLSRWD